MYLLPLFITENSFSASIGTESTSSISTETQIHDTSITKIVRGAKGHAPNISSTDTKNVDIRKENVLDDMTETRKKNSMEKITDFEDKLKDTVTAYKYTQQMSAQTDSHVTANLKNESYKSSDWYCK